MAKEYQNYILRLLPILDFTESEFFYFQTIFKNRELSIVDFSGYNKNSLIRILGSLQISYALFISLKNRIKIIDKYSTIGIRESKFDFLTQLKLSLVTYTENCSRLAWQSTLDVFDQNLSYLDEKKKKKILNS